VTHTPKRKRDAPYPDSAWIEGLGGSEGYGGATWSEPLPLWGVDARLARWESLGW
jgi:hypothetical protein